MTTVTIMETLTPKKLKERRQRGKDAYKSQRNHIKNNQHHPDYDTAEKRKAIYDNYTGCGLLQESAITRLRDRFHYSEQAIQQAHTEYKAGYQGSRQRYEKHDVVHQAVLDKFKPLFDEAS